MKLLDSRNLSGNLQKQSYSTVHPTISLNQHICVSLREALERLKFSRVQNLRSINPIITTSNFMKNSRYLLLIIFTPSVHPSVYPLCTPGTVNLLSLQEPTQNNGSKNNGHESSDLSSSVGRVLVVVVSIVVAVVSVSVRSVASVESSTLLNQNWRY